MRSRSSAIAVARRRRREPSPLLPWLLMALALAVAAASAHAQQGGAAGNPGPAQSPSAPSNLQDGQNPPAGTGSRETGVLRPPEHVDPGMAKPPPTTERYPTPVIPPPGTPGNKQPVVPK